MQAEIFKPPIRSLNAGHRPSILTDLFFGIGMRFILQPWHLLLAILCGMVTERQQRIIEFQNSQIETLLGQLGRNRLVLSDDQRRLLGAKGHALGRQRPRLRYPVSRATWRDAQVLLSPRCLKRARTFADWVVTRSRLRCS